MKILNFPMITIVATTTCNYSCYYCNPKGEGHSCEYGEIDPNLLSMLIKCAQSEGFHSFRLTGGEVTISKYFKKYCAVIFSAKKKGCYATMNTNGSSWEKLIPIFKEMPINLIRISFDAIDNTIFQKMSGSSNYSKVIEGIDMMLYHKIPIQINMVVTKSNFNNISKMIDFCKQRQINLKLLDYELGNKKTIDVWNNEFVNLQYLRNSLRNKYGSEGYFRTTGGYGMAMEVFKVDNIFIRIKDSTVSSTYHPTCISSCSLFPCPEGVFSLIVRPDRTITWCRRRKELSIPIGFSFKTIRNALKSAIKTMNECVEVWHDSLTPSETGVESIMTSEMIGKSASQISNSLKIKGISEIPRYDRC